MVATFAGPWLSLRDSALLGTGGGGSLLDVEITHQPSGKPELVLTGRAQEVARGLGVTRRAVSISHSDRYVVTQVILEADD